MSRLESLDSGSWEEFLRSQVAVLVLGRSDCDHCKRWSAELSEFLDSEPAPWPDVRFGLLRLDTPGLASFKRVNPWVAELEMLPVTIIYRSGERAKEFAGGGVGRLETRLRRVVEAGQRARGGGP